VETVPVSLIQILLIRKYATRRIDCYKYARKTFFSEFDGSMNVNSFMFELVPYTLEYRNLTAC